MLRALRRVSAVVVAFATALSLTGEARADRWSDAAAAIVRLAPAQFTDVPTAVVKTLVDEGCLIPQASSFEKGRHNLIRGHFASRNQVDYAALCSKGGTSHIEILWGGPVRCDSHIEEHRDDGYLQEGEGDSIVFSRGIYPATQKTIAYAFKRIGGRKAPDRMHAGIEDAFLDKASTVLYCAKGLWHWSNLPVAD